MMTFLKLSVVASALLAIIAASTFPARAQVTNQPASAATLAETMEWIKSKINGERTDAVGIHIRTTLAADGCRAHFRKDGGALTLATGAFGLKDIAYLDVVDRPVGTRWTGTFLVFKTANSQLQITRGDLSSTDGRLVERLSSSFEWHLGSVPVGSSTSDLRELGGRLRTAFTHAVELCGGAIRKEPF